jgi:hypothetical protein
MPICFSQIVTQGPVDVFVCICCVHTQGKHLPSTAMGMYVCMFYDIVHIRL